MKKTRFFLFSILLLINSETNAKNAIHNTPAHATHKKHHEPKLTGSNMKNLDMVFHTFPMSLLKINFAQRDIAKVLKSIEQNHTELRSADAPTKQALTASAELEIVTKYLETMLKPVKEFFDIITAYSSLIEPLVKESLLEHRNIKTEDSILINFLNSKKDIITFCAQDITTIDKLSILCREILDFFHDLNESVSEQTQTAYKTLLEHIKNNQKKHTNAGA